MDLRVGEFVELVGWRQGAVFQYHNLITDQRTTSSKPRFGIVPKTGDPFETFRVIRTSDKRPATRKVDMGVVTVNIGRRGVTFKARKAPRDRRFRAKMGVGG